MQEAKASKQPKSARIESADNGYLVSSYNGDKVVKTVHNSMEGAIESMQKMMGMKMHKREDMKKIMK